MLAFAFPDTFQVHGWEMWRVVFAAGSGRCAGEDLLACSTRMFEGGRKNADGLLAAKTDFASAGWLDLHPDLRDMQRAEEWKLGTTEGAQRFVRGEDECFLLHNVAFWPFDTRFASQPTPCSSVVTAPLISELLRTDERSSGLVRVTASCPIHRCAILQIDLPELLCRSIPPMTLASGILSVTLWDGATGSGLRNARGGTRKPVLCPQGRHRVDVRFDSNDLVHE